MKTTNQPELLAFCQRKQIDCESACFYTCDEYVMYHSSTWGGGQGSIAKDIAWDLNGFAESGEEIYVIYPVNGTLRMIQVCRSFERRFVTLYNKDKNNLVIVMG